MPKGRGKGGQLRVAVPERLRMLHPWTGHGRVWATVLAGLEGRLEVRYVQDFELGIGARRAMFSRSRKQVDDVWLLSGHDELPRAAVESGAPIVVQVHEACWEDPAQTTFLDAEFLRSQRTLTAAAVGAASHVITGSTVAAREVIGVYGLAPGAVTVAANGVDGDVFRPGLPGGADVVAAALGGIPRPYVLYVGTVHPRKNVEGLRGAMELLAKRGLEHALAIVPSPAPDRADSAELLAAATAELPGAPGRVAVIERGNDSQIAALMAGAAAFCMPSFGEGFGLPALEAMACGVPVVVSDRGALPEVVGDAGIVTPPTIEQLADALAEVLSDRDRAARLGASARERALQHSWQRTADTWREALEHAAAGGWPAERPVKPPW